MAVSSKEPTSVRRYVQIMAARGDLESTVRKFSPKRAFEIYQKLLRERRPGTQYMVWSLLCRAAGQGVGEAQKSVANFCRGDWVDTNPTREWMREAGISTNDQIAYTWYTLAAASGNSSAQDSLGVLAERMTAKEIAEAEQAVRNWKLGDCPLPY